VTWGSGNPAIATVSALGLVTGIAPGGPVAITATSEGANGVAIITVLAVPVASVAVNPSSGTVAAGYTMQLAPTVRDGGGNLLTGRVSDMGDECRGCRYRFRRRARDWPDVGDRDDHRHQRGTQRECGADRHRMGVRRWHENRRRRRYPGRSLPQQQLGRLVVLLERLSGFGGTLAEIIANNFGNGPAVVDIAPTDRGFNSSTCATWITVSGPITVSPTNSFNAGTFIVGMDIAAGTWRADSVTTGCYWERVRDFSGVLSGIISNNYGPTRSW